MLNLKSYPRALGQAAVDIGRALQTAGTELGVRTVIAPAAPDIGLLAQQIEIPVIAQHADPFVAGAHTGYITPAAIRAVGARGSLVNHSEHPMAEAHVAATVGALQDVGLVPIVCARDVEQVGRLAALHPSYLAVEPPELIGGTVSVSKARPALLRDSVEAVARRAPKTVLLCGAGVHTAEDVRTAIELGTSGVIVSSAVANAAEPISALRTILAGYSAR